MSCVELSLADEEASSNSRYTSHTPCHHSLTRTISADSLTAYIYQHTLAPTLSTRTHSHILYQHMQVRRRTKRPDDRFCPHLYIVYCQIFALLRMCRGVWDHPIVHLRILHNIAYFVVFTKHNVVRFIV